MNADILRAAGAFMAIVGVALVGSTLGFGLSTVHIVGTANCIGQAELCRSLVNPIQTAAVAAGIGGAIAALAGTFAFTQA